MNSLVSDFAIIHHIHEHHGSPWVYVYFYCYQMIAQRRPKGAYALSEVTQELRFFSQQVLTSGSPNGGGGGGGV